MEHLASARVEGRSDVESRPMKKLTVAVWAFNFETDENEKVAEIIEPPRFRTIEFTIGYK